MRKPPDPRMVRDDGSSILRWRRKARAKLRGDVLGRWCVGAAAESLLVEIEIFVVRARRGTAPRSDRSPVSAFEDRAVSLRLHGSGPFVDVPGRIVNAKR